MDQLVNVLLAIAKAHSITEGPGLQTRHMWVKLSLWAQPSYCLCSEYLWGV